MGAMQRPTKADEREDERASLTAIGASLVKHAKDRGWCLECDNFNRTHSSTCLTGKHIQRFG